jgi:Uma2 family endonuclease
VDDLKWDDVSEKIETDRDGNLIMGPPPRTRHRVRQDRINLQLKQLLPEGAPSPKGPVSTGEGVKVADVVWYPAARAQQIEDDGVSLPDFPPDIYVKVRSPKISKPSIQKKATAYLGAGIREVWICDRKGQMSFYSSQAPLRRSALCPGFPEEIPAKFLR